MGGLAYLYQPIYLLIVSVMTLSSYNRYKGRNGLLIYAGINREEKKARALTVIFALFIGFRPVSIAFGDIVNYDTYYKVFYEGKDFTFNWLTSNILFDNYFAWVGSVRLGLPFFFVTIAAIYFGCTYVAIKRLFPNDVLVAYLVFLAAFSTFSYATNGIKAGAAAALFLMALSYRENLKICIPLILVSWGFHHSMMLPVGAFMLGLVFKNPKLYFAGWVACFLCAAAHVSFFQELFAGMTDEQGTGYLTSTEEDWGGKSGFRIDFVLYSAMPVLVGYWAVFKKKIKISKLYACFLNIYLTVNGTWMLCMYAAFTNRIAYLSWFMYPIVLIYPFLNEDWGALRYKTFSNVMMAHLAFTLFMVIIYY